MSRLALVGGGEHARVVAEAASLAGFTVLGCFDPGDTAPLLRLGDDAAFLDGPQEWEQAGSPLALILCVGGGGLRRKLARVYGAAGARWATVVHPAASVSPSAELAPGVFVGPGAVVHTGARVGAHAIVNSGAIVEHDVVIGEGAHVSPAAALGGAASVGAWATIGLGARVRDHVSVGPRAFVGMGAVVVGPVPADEVVMGVPARPRSPSR